MTRNDTSGADGDIDVDALSDEDYMRLWDAVQILSLLKSAQGSQPSMLDLIKEAALELDIKLPLKEKVAKGEPGC